jgi:hypothetical protein
LIDLLDTDHVGSAQHYLAKWRCAARDRRLCADGQDCAVLLHDRRNISFRLWVCNRNRPPVRVAAGIAHAALQVRGVAGGNGSFGSFSMRLAHLNAMRGTLRMDYWRHCDDFNLFPPTTCCGKS